MTNTISKKPTLKVVEDSTPDELPAGHVHVRITKVGNGKVSKGILDDNKRPTFFSWKDEVTFPEHVALALEERGFVEIDD